MAETKFKDSSTDCAICLGSLEDGQTVIELTCGHRWHFECVREQLEHARPNHTQRILFSGCRCAKCGSFCDHKSLENLTRQTDELREKVDTLIMEQLQIDSPHLLKEEAHELNKLLEDGRKMYAFYLCRSCEQPYFGGTVECADQDGGDLENDVRLCATCAPQPQVICRNPHEHRGFHIWKCRFCCDPSMFVCHGTIHFCERCHDRDAKRARNQRQSRLAQLPMEPIPCPGGTLCSYPKQPGQDRHQNGPSSDCEHVYHCAMCLSQPAGSLPEDSGSRNFVINPSGELGLHGWRQLSSSWKVEMSDIPPNETVRTNFVSSYLWCIMGQSVPLHQFVRDPAAVRVEVSAKFMSRTDCPSVFRLQAIIINRQQRELHRASTPELQAPADFWERAALSLDPIPGAHAVVIVVCGKDCRFWQGNYGAKVAECSVRVLGSEDELREILR